MASKLTINKSRSYEVYNPKESRKKHKDERKTVAVEDTVEVEMEEKPSFPIVTHVKQKSTLISSNVDVYINN